VTEVDPGPLDAEPDGAVASTWEEPRGPHVPDRLAAVPWQVWPFLIIAALQIWSTAPSLREAASEPERIFVTLVIVRFLGEFLPTSSSSQELLVRNLVALALGVAFLGGWAYLTVVAGTGWRAGERPRAGWALATAAGLVTIAIQTPLAWLWLSLSPTVTVLVFVGGPALLLVAFLVGLPSAQPAAVADTAVDPGSGSDAPGDSTEPAATVEGSGPVEAGVRP